jgi:hypothetical protein
MAIAVRSAQTTVHRSSGMCARTVAAIGQGWRSCAPASTAPAWRWRSRSSLGGRSLPAKRPDSCLTAFGRR